MGRGSVILVVVLNEKKGIARRRGLCGGVK
jgi:hypothetical protein